MTSSQINYEIVIFVPVAYFANFQNFFRGSFSSYGGGNNKCCNDNLFPILAALAAAVFYLQMLITMMMRRRRRRRNFEEQKTDEIMKLVTKVMKEDSYSD